MNLDQRKILVSNIHARTALKITFVPFFAFNYFPISVVTAESWSLSTIQRQDLLLIEFISFCGLLSYFLVLRYVWILAHRPELPIHIIMLLSGMGGALQGLAVGLFIRPMYLSVAPPIAYRIILGFVGTFLWLPLNSFLISVIYNFKNFRNALLMEELSKSRMRFYQSGLSTKIREKTNEQIYSILVKSRDTFRGTLGQSLSSSLEAYIDPKQLRNYAQRDLRELSQALWSRSALPKSHVDERANSRFQIFLDLNRSARQFPPLESHTYCLILVALTVPTLNAINDTFTFFQISLTFCLIYILLSLGNILWDSLPNHRSSILFFRSLTSSFLLSVLLSVQLITNLGIYFIKPLSFFVITFSFLLLLDTIINIIHAAMYSNDSQARAMQSILKMDGAYEDLEKEEIAHIARQWAQYIHGNLQARLLSAAAILEDPESIYNADLKSLALEQSKKIMNQDFHPPHDPHCSIDSEVNFRISAWADLIECTVDKSEDADLSWIPSDLFGLALDEAIANAFRHGKATKMNILLRALSGEGLECIFSDNGIGPGEQTHEGLGAQIFNQLSAGNWSRSLNPDGIGTRVHMLIPALELAPVGGGSSVG